MGKFIRREMRSSFEDFNLYRTNRCGTTDKNVAEKYGWTDKQFNDFQKRVKKIKDVIERDGVTVTSVVTVAYVNGNLYIVDGQGRIAALTEINEERKKKGMEPLEIAVNFFMFDSEEELQQETISMNTVQKTWDSNDKLRAIYLLDGSEDCLASFSEIEYWSDRLNISFSQVMNIIWGQGATKEVNLRNQKNNKPRTLKDNSCWSSYKRFFEVFEEYKDAVKSNDFLDERYKNTLIKTEKVIYGYRNIFTSFEDWMVRNSIYDNEIKENYRSELIEIFVETGNALKTTQLRNFNRTSSAVVVDNFKPYMKATAGKTNKIRRKLSQFFDEAYTTLK